MALVLTNEGEVKILSIAFGKDAQENLTLKLFTNNYTPVEASTASSFTEATGYGYAAASITASDWTLVAGDPTYATNIEKVFSFTGALGTVYGYYLIGATSGKVYWAEKFTNAITIQNNGDQIRITPVFGLE